MMRSVWILNHYSQEPGSPGGTRHFSLAQNLVRYGWQASIVAASTEHGTGRSRLSDGCASRLDVIAGTPFLWVKTSGYTGNGSQRIRNMLDYTWRVLQPSALGALVPPDAVIGSSVHPLAAWAGARLARRYRVPFLFEVRDLWPQTLIEMGRLKPDSVATYLLRRLERRLYLAAKKIVVLLPRADDYIESVGIPRSKVVWIPNGVDLSAWPEPSQRGEPTGEFKLLYFGAHGRANALNTVIDAMRLVASAVVPAPIKLHLTGDGPDKEALVARARALALDNVTFHTPIPKEEIAALASSADAFVLSVRDLPNLYRYGISMNKLFDYMAAGRPIIMASAAANDPVAEAGAGLTVKPENPQLLADAIVALAWMPHADRVRMGNAARAHVETHYNFDMLARRLAMALDEACAGQ